MLVLYRRYSIGNPRYLPYQWLHYATAVTHCLHHTTPCYYCTTLLTHALARPTSQHHARRPHWPQRTPTLPGKQGRRVKLSYWDGGQDGTRLRKITVPGLSVWLSLLMMHYATLRV